MHDLLVLGGGPAGLTATVYAIQKRLDVLLITRDLGGKTNFYLQLPFVERHMVINGDEVVNRFTREIEYLDWARRFDSVEGVEPIEGGYRVSLAGGDVEEARALIVATGARGQLLDVPGERDFMMRGLCYSAVSYAPLFIDRTAAVVGCGDLALRAVAELSHVARRVTLISEECDTLDSPLGKQIQNNPHVDVLMGCDVREVKGDLYARSIVVENEDGEREIEVDAIFVEKDLLPRSRIVDNLVELDEKRRIIVDERNRTSMPGIFAAGDVTNSFAEQVLIAIGEGAKAALAVYDYLLQQDAVQTGAA